MKIIKPGFDRKVENPNDFYPTPAKFCYNYLRILRKIHLNGRNIERILDPGTGLGIWASVSKIVWPNSEVWATDITDSYRVSPYLSKYCDVFVEGDFRVFQSDVCFDLIVGNPPYTVSNGKRDLYLSQKFIDVSLNYLQENGFLTFLLPTVFVEGAHRGNTLFKTNPPTHIYQSVHRIPFDKTKRGTNSTAYAMYIWEKTNVGKQTLMKWYDYRTGDFW